MASSSSSSSPRTWRYRVFTSFHGPDVRKTFLTHLRKQFSYNGITMFDDQEIERSQIIAPALSQAIRESRISIVVLSKNYASSSLCLDKLLEIFKCKEEIGQIVMTIFYGVDPSDVRNKTGEFGIAFNKTCARKKDEEKREKWSKALEDVGNIAGEHFLKWDNESKMIEKIARDVSNKLNATISWDFEDMVGIEAHLQKMQSLLRLNYEDGAMIVGICGPAGIGKTTIARALHSRLSSNFQLNCFLENIRESSNSGLDDIGLKLRLQEQLLSKILNQNGIRIYHLSALRKRLCDQKVLLILDDVDDLQQLEALANETNWFGPGSRIIVTTEDRELLEQHDIYNTYHVAFPIEEEARKILCRYAFRKSSKPDGFEKLIERVTKFCSKLPLGLRVMGSYLCKKTKDYWEDILQGLENSLDLLENSLEQDIERVLRFGYDSLREKDQLLFLLIAVFFNYKEDGHVKEMLAENNLNVRLGLKTLANKSLIQISSEGNIVMHKLLQQVGRKVIQRQDFGRHKILIDTDDILQFQKIWEGIQLKLKGCGIHLLEDGPYLDDRPCIPYILPEVCEGDNNTRDNLGGLKFYKESIRGDNFLGEVNSDATSNSRKSIEIKMVGPVKEETNHGKLSKSSTMVTYERHMPQYQMFINFWGEEVRFSFISHLVSALSREGVNVFTGKYEKRGEDLENSFRSIEDSNIALVIFSSRYTESRWCLEELVKIKEQMDEDRIIPIFYKVQHSHVKELDGDFGLQFWNLWRVHRDHHIINWKDALESVAAMKGLYLEEKSSESKFITSIVKEVLQRISLHEGENSSKFSTGKRENESFLNKCSLFGLAQRMKQLEQKLEFDCNETRIIGVVGIAGIGKTTLAMKLYEKWNCKFVRCVAHLGIHKKLKDNNRPEWLQKTLFEVLLEGESYTTHESLKDELLKTKVFVVLDDVSDKKQLEFLHSDLNWIKKGSKVVITVRDKSLIEEFVHDTYVVPPLNYGEALELFRYHAYSDHVFHPTVTSMKLCREFVDCAGGNPLVIKLLGKQLHGRDEAQWEMRQGDLTHLGMVILNIFRFRFDELSDKQKDVFLDIACFFRSENDNFVRSLLDSGDYNAIDAESEVRDLTHKCMIAISGCRVEMHDLLYMFGKIFSSQALIQENGGKSRLWYTEEIIDALINQKDTKSIRGIFLDMSEVTKGMVLHRTTFINMINLRYLKIYDSYCPQSCKPLCKLHFSNELDFPLKEVRYLHWVKFPLKELPRDFKPENLVDLRLPYSKLKCVWESVKDTPRLKWVDLSHSSKLLNLSALSKAESLQRLNLEGCTNLDELPGEMQNMKSLVYLNIRGCIRLSSLPKMNLISLKTLILSDCSNLKEFQVISISLEVLHLDGTAIKGLPLAIQKLQRLVVLNLKSCKMLECLPNCLGKLKVLEELILSGCSRLKNLPDVRQSMKHVQVLLLDGTAAKEMPKISCFTGSQGQAFVDMLLQSSGSYPREWPAHGFDGVYSLRRLCLSGNDFASLQNDIGQLYNLTWLDVKHCKKLRSVPMLPPRLQYFDAHGCDSLEKVSNPLALLVLTEQVHAIFNFSNCNKLDQDATDAIISYTRRRSQLMLSALSRYNGGFTLEALIGTCFPGCDVPKWFSHQGSGSVLEPKLPSHWCDNRFTGIALCAVILFHGYHGQRNHLLVDCKCEFENEDGSGIHFSCTVGGWNGLSNTPQKMESSHVFIGYTSISKHGGYDEKRCFCAKSSLEFQVTDGTEKVVDCEVLQCGFSLVYATNDRENICWDAKNVVVPKGVRNVSDEEESYDIQYQSYSGPTQQRDENFITDRKSDAMQNLWKTFEDKTKIQDVWRFDTDQLTKRHNDVLLDIACFFRSEDEYFIKSLLDSGDPDSTNAVSEVRDLAEKFLITICDGRVETNEQRYRFGKDLNSPGELRLWKYKDILDKLRRMKQQEANNVRGIFLDMSEVIQSIALERSTLIHMRNLRYLKICESCCPRKGKPDCKLQFPDGIDFRLEEVRYFHWLKFPLEELPSDFRPKNLVDLRLPYSKVKRLWKGVKDTPKLKWVDLSHSSKLINLSALSKAESLQKLSLEGCTNLDELPGEMQNMKSLVYLNLRGCIRLSSLPKMNLISLKTLILSDCSNLKEFHVISINLEVLHLDGTAITRLPLASQKLQRLNVLNLKNCKMLECLPNSLGKLKVLEELILSGCSRLKNLPDVRHSMKHVQILLFDGAGVDEMLNISCFIGFEGQASVDMSFQNYGSFGNPSEWPRVVNRVSSLRRLCLSGNDFASLKNDIGQLYNLIWLDVKQCKKLRSVPMLPPRLQYFDAHGCDSLERIANPLALQVLTEQIHATFNFSNCNKLDQDATDAIISYTRWKSQLILDALSRYNGGFTLEPLIGTCFPGWEVPAWFNHRASGSFLEAKLPPHWCDSRFTGIALCAVILFPVYQNQRNSLVVKCNCEIKNEDGSRIRFNCPVGSWSEPGKTIESSHVVIGYTSKFYIRKLREDNKEGCTRTETSFVFQVTDGTKELDDYEVLKCGFSLVYASDDLEVNSCEYRTPVEANQDIISSGWVQDFFGYIFLVFSCVIIFAILSFSVIVIAPQYYSRFSDFCWSLLFRVFFFVAFGLFLKQETRRENQS